MFANPLKKTHPCITCSLTKPVSVHSDHPDVSVIKTAAAVNVQFSLFFLLKQLFADFYYYCRHVIIIVVFK